MITEPGATVKDFYVVGGTLPMEAESYVVREADRRLFAALQGGNFCYVLNSRQMGKSSVCVRTKVELEKANVRTAFVDLTKIGGRNVSPEQWYAGILVEIGRSLNLRTELMAFWKDHQHLSPMQRLFSSLREVVLAKIEQPVVLFIDEIDATRSLSFSADEFFAAVRECFNRRVQDPEYKRLTFCLLGVAVPSDLIQDTRTTPFNIGERILLSDFTLEEAMEFANGLDGRGELVKRVHYWTHGHPFLTQSLCQAVAKDPAIQTEADVDALVQRDLFDPKARDTNINLADVSSRVLNGYTDGEDVQKYRADVLSAYQTSLKGSRKLLDDEANRIVAILKMSGLVRPDGKALVPRNRIYEQVFNKEWIKENMPGQELRRQKKAYWLGVIRTGVIAAVIVINVGFLMIDYKLAAHRNNTLMLEARGQRDRARYEAYVADVNLMRTAYEDNETIFLRKLLNDTATNPFRNIEWNYWNSKLNDTPLRVDEPQGAGNSDITDDGKQISIIDKQTQKLFLYSYPDLHPLGSYAVPKGCYQLNVNGKWLVLNIATWPKLGVTDLAGQKLGDITIENESGYKLQGITGGKEAVAFALFSAYPKPQVLFTVWGFHPVREIARTTVPGVNALSVGIASHGEEIAYQEYDPETRVVKVVVRATNDWHLIDEMPSTAVTNEYIFSKDAHRLLVTNTAGGIIVRDVTAHRNLLVRQTNHAISAASASTDLSRFLVFGPNMAVDVWDLASGKVIASKIGAFDSTLAPDGKSFAVSGDGTRIYTDISTKATPLPSVSSGRVFGTNSAGDIITAKDGRLSSLNPVTLAKAPETWDSISQDMDWGGSSIDKDQMMIENTSTGQKLGNFPSSSPFQFAPNKAGTFIAEANLSRTTVAMLDASGKKQWEWSCDNAPIDSIRWSHDERYLAIGTYQGNAYILDATTGRLLRSLFGINPIGTTAFSPDDRLLAVAPIQSSSEFQIFDWRVGASLVALGHSGAITNVQFSPDGARVLSSSMDGTARLWDPNTGRELLRLGDKETRLAAAWFAADESCIYAVDDKGFVHTYPTSVPSGT
ncbi:MAG TPA: AAA-like domain-containing protein [Fimbriimonadaceae bacterium]|jgi:WD40 repeat protein